jgi:hypothetical protein
LCESRVDGENDDAWASKRGILGRQIRFSSLNVRLAGDGENLAEDRPPEKGITTRRRLDETDVSIRWMYYYGIELVVKYMYAAYKHVGVTTARQTHFQQGSSTHN